MPQDIHSEIMNIAHKNDAKILRARTTLFDFKSTNRKEISELVARMKKIMRGANGIGLAANQIGLRFRMFIAEVPGEQGERKFYAIFNPTIEKSGAETATLEEGCLSVPGLYGQVSRSERVTLSGYDKMNKPLKVKAWGLLARVFQHEVDHLDGKLFIDRASETYHLPSSERLKAKQDKISN